MNGGCTDFRAPSSSRNSRLTVADQQLLVSANRIPPVPINIVRRLSAAQGGGCSRAGSVTISGCSAAWLALASEAALQLHDQLQRLVSALDKKGFDAPFSAY
jgi:hypothetical protein